MNLSQYCMYIKTFNDPVESVHYHNFVVRNRLNDIPMSQLWIQRQKYLKQAESLKNIKKPSIGNKFALKASEKSALFVSMYLLDSRSELLQEIKDFSGVPPTRLGAVSGYHYNEARRRFNETIKQTAL